MRGQSLADNCRCFRKDISTFHVLHWNLPRNSLQAVASIHLMSFDNRQTQRVRDWNAARPTGVIVDPTAPSYMPIPRRPPPGTPVGQYLGTVKTANLIVSANNSTYVQAGELRDGMTRKLGQHRAKVEYYQRTVDDVSSEQTRECWTFFKRPEDPRLAEARVKADHLYRDIEHYAAETTTSAQSHPEGNIRFEHSTFADPFIAPLQRAATRERSESEDEEEDQQRRASVSSANGDWGSVKRERGPLQVMNPGTTVASSSTRAQSDTGSDQWSIASTTGEPPRTFHRQDRNSSRQHLVSHAAPPPVAPPPAHTHSNAYHTAYPPGPSSATHTARNAGAGAGYPPSSSVKAQSVRPPPAAHVRHSSGSTHPSARASTVLTNDTGPTYYTGNNATPPYERNLGPFETQIADTSFAHGQYEMATHYVEHRRMRHPQGPSRR